MKPKSLRLPLPVIDSTRHIALHVSDEQCQLGSRDSPEACALALAAKAEVRGLQSVQVFRTIAYFVFKTHVERFAIYGSTARMIRHFDRTGQFKPGLYEFSPVPPMWSLGARRADGKARPGNRHVDRPTTVEGRKRRATKPHYARPRGSGEFGFIVIPAPPSIRKEKS